jgi:hypothetical protein
MHAFLTFVVFSILDPTLTMLQPTQGCSGSITTDLESDLIEGMLCCDLSQINSTPNQNGTFLDLVFSNLITDITVEICESPLLGLGRHHRHTSCWWMCVYLNLKQRVWMRGGLDSGLLTVRR